MSSRSGTLIVAVGFDLRIPATILIVLSLFYASQAHAACAKIFGDIQVVYGPAVANDILTLDGTGKCLTWAPGIGVVPGGPGTVTSVGLSMPSEFGVANSPVTTSGTLAVTKATELANTVWAGPTSGAAAVPTFRALVAADVPPSVTSVGLSMPGEFSVANSPITSSGTLAVTKATELANTVWAGPTSGAAAVPVFRTLGAADFACPTGQINVGGTCVSNTQIVLNDSGTGTTLNKLASWAQQIGPIAIITTTSQASDIIGIVTAGAGTSGQATITTFGPASCVFDSATTAGDFVKVSTGTAGDCTDAGATIPVAAGTSRTIIGTVTTTNGGAGTYTVNVNLMPPQTSAAMIGNVAVCDNATLKTNNNNLFRYTSGSGVDQFCNDNATSVSGVYNWAGLQSFNGSAQISGGKLTFRDNSSNANVIQSGPFQQLPTVSTCGSSPIQPAGGSSNLSGEFTVGTTAGGVCTLNLTGGSCTALLECTVTDGTGARALWLSNNNTTSIKVNGLNDSDVVHYICACN